MWDNLGISHFSSRRDLGRVGKDSFYSFRGNETLDFFHFDYLQHYFKLKETVSFEYLWNNTWKKVFKMRGTRGGIDIYFKVYGAEKLTSRAWTNIPFFQELGLISKLRYCVYVYHSVYISNCNNWAPVQNFLTSF